MAKCAGCSSTPSCACTITIDPGTCLVITGTGSLLDPFIIASTARVSDLATFAMSGGLTAPTVGTLRFRFPFGCTIEGVSAAVNTAPTGADIILDVNKNGASIFIFTPPTIPAGTFDSGVELVPDDTGILEGDYLQIDIDQVGSTVPGSDLTVFIRYSRAIVCPVIGQEKLMALLFMDGFDDGLLASKWSFVSSVGIVSGGRTLNRALLQDNSDSVLRKTVAIADYHVTFITGFAFMLGSSYNASQILTFLSDTNATAHILMGVNTNNAIEIRRGGTLILTTANNSITPGVFSYVEVLVTLSDTVGVVTVRVDGVQVGTFSGDTKNGGTSSTLEAVTFNASSGPNGTVFYLDDFYLLNGAGAVNSTFRGDSSVLTRFPDGNGNYSQGVNSGSTSVNNYTYVDENPPNTTDYVAFATTGDKDTYTFQDIPAGTVYGIQQAMYASKSDAGARTMRNIQRIAGADFASAVDQSLGVTPTYAAKLDVLQVSPATGVSWTVTELNGTEFGTEARP